MGGTDFFLDLSMNEITKLGGKENKQMSLKKELTQHQIYRKSFALSFDFFFSFTLDHICRLPPRLRSKMCFCE